MKLLLSCIWHELFRIFSESALLFIMLLSVTVYVIIYSQPLLNTQSISLIAIDQDQSTYSKKLIEKINKADKISLTHTFSSLDEAKPFIIKNNSYGFLVIPTGFQQAIQAKNHKPVYFYDGGNYTQLHDYIVPIIINSVEQFVTTPLLTETVLVKKNPFSNNSIALFNSPLNFSHYLIPGIIILVMQQSLLIGCVLLGIPKIEHRYIKDERLFTYYGYGTTSATTIVMGKSIVYLTLYLLQFWLITALMRHLYQLPNLAGNHELFLLGLPFLLAVSLLGISAGLVIKQAVSAFILLLPLSLPFFFLSGLIWPVESMPPVIYYLRYLVPSSAAIEGFVHLNNMGNAIADIKPQLTNLWSLVLAYGIIAVFLARKHLQLKLNLKLSRI